MKKYSLIIRIVFLLLILNSCNLDNLDFSKLSKEISVNPTVVMPLVKANVTFGDLLKTSTTDSMIQNDASGLVKIVYNKQNFYEYNVRDLLDFPNKTNNFVNVPCKITLNKLVDIMSPSMDNLRSADGTNQAFPAFLYSGPAVDFSSDEKITSFNTITLSQGNLDIVLENKMTVPISVSGSLYDKLYNKTIREFTFQNVPAGSTVNDPFFPIAGFQLSNQVELRLTSFETVGSSSPVLINLMDYFKLTFKMTNLDFQSITGDFGKHSVQINNKFDLNVALFKHIEGGLKLSNPKIELTIHNPIGVPAKMNLELSATNTLNEQVVLKRTPADFDFPIPEKINDVATGKFIFDKDNSNIVDFIALPPSGKITYQGQVDFNTLDVTPQNLNFLGSNTKIGIDLLMELPLELKVSELTFSETEAFSNGDYDNIEEADVILNARNEIPLDIDLQLFFVDTLTNYQYGETQRTKILSSAEVDQSGSITPVQSSKIFSLSASEMDNLRKCNAIVITGTFSSPSDGKAVAKLYTDSKIELNIVLRSKVKF
ncbi:MAG: hypothetical protein WAO52_19105 [Prolixibacteraceae bacterium]